MDDERRVQDAVLALMHLNEHKDTYGWWASKCFPWEATDGLHERGRIGEPRSKATSVALRYLTPPSRLLPAADEATTHTTP